MTATHFHYSHEKASQIAQQHNCSYQKIHGPGTCALYANLKPAQAALNSRHSQHRNLQKADLRKKVEASIKTLLEDTADTTITGIQVSIDDHRVAASENKNPFTGSTTEPRRNGHVFGEPTTCTLITSKSPHSSK
jgi:hypothetical protein